MAEIKLAGLTFTYRGAAEATLRDLALTVRRGEAHALLGSSGAGKTTLLNLLSGLLPAPAGSIFFDGQDVGALEPWARKVTQVFQFPVLYEAMTVAENLSFPMRELPAAQQRRRAEDVAARLGIADVLRLRPGRLPLVQKQLVAIGKALMRPDVSLVLLDEPLTAAEPEHKWQLRQTLRALQADLGATMIYVTHDQTEALTFADRVSVLHEGRILQTDTPEALVAEPDHEHVGYFVGSPGMNLLDGEIRSGRCFVDGEEIGLLRASDGPCRFGFRPEWATIRPGAAGDEAEYTGHLRVNVRATRTLSTVRDVPHGLVIAELPTGLESVELITRQDLDGIFAGPAIAQIDPDRLLAFRDGLRIRAAGTGVDR
ncbi:MAG: ABC transporter ATP-binding protein [Gammaproteobacteria bacterium]|jgi:glycerol transport system ATP-binding protein|nr:MAG: ABC transporter ATP-binding protein [Gammaproteobacteria bacterium]